jgi:hypothetical protein
VKIRHDVEERTALTARAAARSTTAGEFWNPQVGAEWVGTERYGA